MANHPRKKRPRKKRDLLLKKQKARAILERHQAAKRICDAGWCRVNMEAVRPILKADPFKYLDEPGPYNRSPIRFITEWKPKMLEIGIPEDKSDLWMKVFYRILEDFGDDGRKLLWLYRKPKKLSKSMKLMWPAVVGGTPMIVMALRALKSFGCPVKGHDVRSRS